MPTIVGTTGKALLVTATLCGMLIGTSCLSRAQQSGTVSGLNQKIEVTLNDVTFSDTLDTIRKQTHLAIVADNASSEKVAKVKVLGTAREALSQIADAFDYVWQEGPGGIILMNRRFKDTGSVPQIHFQEIRQTTRNILMVLQALNPDVNGVDWPDLELAFANTLTQEQTHLLMQGDRLYASALTQSQLQHLQTLIGSATFGGECFRWKELLRVLDALQRSELILTETQGVKSFLVHDPLSDTNAPVGIPTQSPAFIKKKL